jgi:hypothetical protein
LQLLDLCRCATKLQSLAKSASPLSLKKILWAQTTSSILVQTPTSFVIPCTPKYLGTSVKGCYTVWHPATSSFALKPGEPTGEATLLWHLTSRISYSTVLHTHTQNRFRPIAQKKKFEHRPCQPFLALTLKTGFWPTWPHKQGRSASLWWFGRHWLFADLWPPVHQYERFPNRGPRFPNRTLRLGNGSFFTNRVIFGYREQNKDILKTLHPY